MESHFMKIRKKRWHYRLLAISTWLIAIVILLLVGGKTYYDNTNNPIKVKTHNEYIKAVENDSYIQISAEEIFDLGIVMTETKSKLGVKVSEKDRAAFVAINLDDQIMTISLPTKIYQEMIQQPAPYILKGKLKEFKYEDLTFFRNSLVESGVPADKVNSLLNTYYLDYQKPIQEASVCFVLGGVLAIFLLKIFLPVMNKNRTALKSLKNYFDGDLERACQQIDSELELPDIYTHGPIIITENFIMTNCQQIVLALPLKELMWAYKKTVKRKNSLVLVFSDKSTYSVDLCKKSQSVDEVLHHISQNGKSPILGYSDELSGLFKKNPDEFVNQWKLNTIGEN